MIRNMCEADVEILAELHARNFSLPNTLNKAVRNVYRDLLHADEARVLVCTDDKGEVECFTVLSPDRLRLISQLFSLNPLHYVKTLICNPALFSKLNKIFPYCKGKELCFTVANTNSHRSVSVTSLAELEQSAKIAFDEIKTAPPKEYTLKDRIRCICRFELLVVHPVYCLALIPFAFSLALLGTKLDKFLGIGPVICPPWNYLAMFVMLVLGYCLLMYSYSYLVLEGKGGPIPPFSSKTCVLVTSGPYTYVRHPSVLAKLIGVIGLGFGINSWSFIALIIPLLLVWSVFWNTHRQDTDLVKVFGEDYLKYKRETPLLIPFSIRKDSLIQ